MVIWTCRGTESGFVGSSWQVEMLREVPCVVLGRRYHLAFPPCTVFTESLKIQL